jgi:hypothetical protein
MKGIYELYGKGEEVETILIDAPHNYNKQSREAVYKFMARKVLNDPDGSKYSETHIRQEKLQDMMVFAGRPLPSNAVRYDQLFSNWVREAKKQNDSTMDRKEMKERLALALATRWPATVEQDTKGDQVVLSRPGAGDRVAGLLSKGKRGATLVIHPDGADAARKSAQATQAASAGRTVFAIDAFQTGSAVTPRDRSHAYFLTFNRSDDANRVQDILTAIAYLRQTGESDIALVGIGKAAVWATFAAAVSDVPVQLQAPLGTFKGDDQDFIDNFFVPGIQRAGGLRAAQMLTSAASAAK